MGCASPVKDGFLSREAARLWYAGHGDARGDWCLDDGKVSYLDVITGWQKIDEEIPKGTKNYRKGTLTIVADCCHSGQWALDAAWHYAEMRGRGGGDGKGVKQKDPEGVFEYLERILVQAA